MNENGNGQASVGSGAGAIGGDQMPYYREYVEQILRPKAQRIIEEVRASLSERVWGEVLQRMAMEQGGGTDAVSLARLRGLLEQSLNLRMSAHLVADFDGKGYASAQGGGAAPGEPGAEVIDQVGGVRGGDVVDQGFPNNPLARAVGGVRRITR